MSTKKAFLAGSWYPGTASGCEKEIKGFIQDAETPGADGRVNLGGIVPHAGWYFSGSIACNVIRSLADESPPDVIAVFGMHLHPGSSCHIMAEGEWETPFGNLVIEKDLAGELVRQFDFEIETAAAPIQENTIELQLPFIKYFLDSVKIVPMGVPPVESSLEIGKAAVKAAARLGLRMKVLGSTDLTHYGENYGFTPKGPASGAIDWMRNENDRRVIDAIMEMNPEKVIDEGLTNQNACCAGAAATAIAAAGQLGANTAENLAYATSYDKNPGNNFVGYAGIVFQQR